MAEEFTREGLAIEVAGAIRSRHVIDALSRLVSERGAPMFIRSDNGPEFVSRAFAHNVVLDFSRPGKPTDNAFIESFNGRFRAECLNAHWFLTLDDAQQKLEDWRRYYNEERPHGAIGQKAPITLINRADATNPAARVEVENSS